MSAAGGFVEPDQASPFGLRRPAAGVVGEPASNVRLHPTHGRVVQQGPFDWAAGDRVPLPLTPLEWSLVVAALRRLGGQGDELADRVVAERKASVR